MLTTTPNASVSPYHHRMPFILRAEQLGAWLGDPCALQPGWFRLNFTTFLLEPDTNLPVEAKKQVTATINRLRLNNDSAYVNERARVVFRFAAGKMAFWEVQRLYPFIASEMIAKNFDVAIKPSVVAALAKRPWLAN